MSVNLAQILLGAVGNTVVWYVNSAIGTDAASPRGKSRFQPLATLGQAVTNASSGDIIILMQGHTEVPTTKVSTGKSLFIFGLGTAGNGKPSVSFQFNNAANANMWGLSATCEVHNVYFKGNLQANVAPLVTMATGQGSKFFNCYFEGTAFDQGGLLEVGAISHQARVVDTTFVSVSTTTRPLTAILVSAAVNDLELDGVTIDGGAIGWGANAFATNGVAITRLKAQRMSCLRGSDIFLDVGTTGWLTFGANSGSVRVNWSGSQCYANGAGETTGDALVTGAPLYMSGVVWYVNSATGADAGGSAGQFRERPLATLGQALTNASANDIIVLMDGHTETAGGLLTLNKAGIAIAGAGSSSGLPTVNLSPDLTGANGLFAVTAAAVELRNLKLKKCVGSNPNVRVAVQAADFHMIGCYVECSGNDVAAALDTGAGNNRTRVKDTTFVSIATAVASLPTTAITESTAAAGFELENVTIDAGAFGFSSQWALDFSTASVTLFRGRSLFLLNLATASVRPSGSGGWLDQYTTLSAVEY